MVARTLSFKDRIALGKSSPQTFGLKTMSLGFPGGPVVKNLPWNARDTSSTPGLGKSCVPWSKEARVPQPLGLYSRASEPHTEPMYYNSRSLRTRAHALLQEKPLKRKACALQPERSPCSPQLEESLSSSEDPAQPKTRQLLIC